MSDAIKTAIGTASAIGAALILVIAACFGMLIAAAVAFVVSIAAALAGPVMYAVERWRAR